MNLLAPFAGTVVSVPHSIDETISAGAPVIVLEAMKMEHELIADRTATLESLEVQVGDTVAQGQLLAVLGEAQGEPALASVEVIEYRDALEEVRARHALGLDAARPEAVAARRARGHRTARENLADLLDPDSFVEYGPLMFAAQERRRSLQELIERTPADGLVGGIGAIAGNRCVAMSYDYTVLATTRSWPAHRGCATTRRRTGCSSSRTGAGSRWSCSPRAAAAGRAMWTSRSSPGSTAAPFTCSPA
jgi:hypothetical protein